MWDRNEIFMGVAGPGGPNARRIYIVHNPSGQGLYRCWGPPITRMQPGCTGVVLLNNHMAWSLAGGHAWLSRASTRGQAMHTCIHIAHGWAYTRRIPYRPAHHVPGHRLHHGSFQGFCLVAMYGEELEAYQQCLHPLRGTVCSHLEHICVCVCMCMCTRVTAARIA